MADNDQSLYNLRFNQVANELEGFGGGTPQWTPLIVAGTGGISQLTGDVTAGPGTGSQVASLATVNPDVGSFTNASITVDGKGRITAASSGAGTTPGGANRNVQFNDSGTFGGNNGLKYLNDEEVAITGASQSNLSLNNDTANHIYFNSSDQSTTFGVITHDGTLLSVTNEVGDLSLLSPTGMVHITTNYTFQESTGNIAAPGTGEFRFVDNVKITPTGNTADWTFTSGELDHFNDAGGSLVFNNRAGSQTFVNLTADTDHSLRITGNNNLAKFAISDGYVVFGVNDLTQDGSAVFTVHGGTSLDTLITSDSIEVSSSTNPVVIIQTTAGTGSNAELRLSADNPDNAVLNFTNLANSVQYGYLSVPSGTMNMNFVAFGSGINFTPNNSGGQTVSITSAGLASPIAVKTPSMLDASNVQKIDVNGATLIDSSTNHSVEWEQRRLRAADTTKSVEWDVRILYNTAEGAAINWSNPTAILVSEAMSMQGNVLHSVGQLGLNTASPDASALLDMPSSTQGFAPPRMTTTQKNAIASPLEGLIVYDTTLHKLCVRTVVAWETITSI